MSKVDVDEIDKMFFNDSVPLLEALNDQQRILSYGGNDLHKPSRALTENELEVFDSIAAPKFSK